VEGKRKGAWNSKVSIFLKRIVDGAQNEACQIVGWETLDALRAARNSLCRAVIPDDGQRKLLVNY
jgi:hypothetical protein